MNSSGIYPDNYEKYAPKETASLRLNHYLPCLIPSQAVGLPPHQDSGLFTILLQGTVSGLQVLNNDRWVPVRPESEAFAVNVGTGSRSESDIPDTRALLQSCKAQR